ncbi:hypothetical protein RRG08_011887 [Elysia crispata]|uniref:Uncharacterized protein n=1 Tax=Elysia crispata TaxID=231223 RepID=A0AAE1DIH5_9GAST|nr:hypothetical protein RRG08_011887 [Elysia crispata]
MVMSFGGGNNRGNNEGDGDDDDDDDDDSDDDDDDDGGGDDDDSNDDDDDDDDDDGNDDDNGDDDDDDVRWKLLTQTGSPPHGKVGEKRPAIPIECSTGHLKNWTPSSTKGQRSRDGKRRKKENPLTGSDTFTSAPTYCRPLARDLLKPRLAHSGVQPIQSTAPV